MLSHRVTGLVLRVLLFSTNSERLTPGVEMLDVGAKWRAKAACLGENTEMFFVSGNTGLAAEQTDRAKAVCAVCTVRDACLEWAIATNQQDGVWGGLSEDERRTLRRSRQRGCRRQ
jgi:WhiB family redox-sensing transcriptional regulator